MKNRVWLPALGLALGGFSLWAQETPTTPGWASVLCSSFEVENPLGREVL